MGEGSESRSRRKPVRPGRPVLCRCVVGKPRATCFKPEGVSPSRLKDVVITLDELEAIRLADKLGLYHAEAAGLMKVSRQTFGRILDSAHRKVALALVEGHSICIEGGHIQPQDPNGEPDEPGICVCLHCGTEIPHHNGTPCRTLDCPDCGRPMVRRGRCSSID
ncbi:MAG: hypothetical protein A3K90_05365 [Pelodictyon luteolum]|uniref:UPF0251 protein Plut_1128 n=3 Tax=Pelodictyon luteolum TaxID=1100 RepID=Q3B3U1_CHLL3|nr:DUF134 domain-containing protein [Pelodictyon luteolum]ABB23990.1 conserved hypothetical protein [Pelodictyon luteolum DSM 273]KZK75150.1 MAG: hypothetical protein A3K90_05365 [Pelodictyon luteolum]